MIATLIGMSAPAEAHPSPTLVVTSPNEPPRVTVPRSPPATTHHRFVGTQSPSVPASLAVRDLARISQSLLNALGAVAMTIMTVGAGFTGTAIVAGLAFGLLRESPTVSSPRILEATFLCVACAGMVAIAATLFVGLLHFVLPRAMQFAALLLRAPWFVPSTLACAPMAGLWRAGLWWRESWEAGLPPHGFAPRWSFRSRKYNGRVGCREIEVRQDFLGGALELRCRVPRQLPAAYVGPQRLAGSIGILLPLIRCPALRDAELLLRDGQLVIRRRWVRPNISHLATLIDKVERGYATGGLPAELRAISLLADWRQIRALSDDRWRSPWFDAPAVARYLKALKPIVRAAPPTVTTLAAILSDTSIRDPAKSWLMSVIVDRLDADDARRLANVGPDAEPDPIRALLHAPRWPAWVAVRRLALEGGPDALAALQALVSAPSTPGPLARAGRRTAVQIINKNGGIHTLTGHLSMVGDDGGRLAVVEAGGLAPVHHQ